MNRNAIDSFRSSDDRDRQFISVKIVVISKNYKIQTIMEIVRIREIEFDDR